MGYTLIASQVLSASAASVTFSSIPQTYKTLILKVSARSDDTGALPNDLYIRFNGDTVDTNYSMRRIYGDGSAAGSDNVSGGYGPLRLSVDGGNQTASTFGSIEATIPNYASAVAHVVSVDSCTENNAAAAYSAMLAGLCSTAAAITSIVIKPYGGTNIVSGSSFYLYGID